MGIRVRQTDFLCISRPVVTLSPEQTHPKSGLFIRPERCIHCGRMWRTDELMDDLTDRSCPVLLRAEVERLKKFMLDTFPGAET